MLGTTLTNLPLAGWLLGLISLVLVTVKLRRQTALDVRLHRLLPERYPGKAVHLDMTNSSRKTQFKTEQSKCVYLSSHPALRGQVTWIGGSRKKKKREEMRRTELQAFTWHPRPFTRQPVLPTHPALPSLCCPLSSNNPDYASKCYTCPCSRLAPAFALPRTPFGLILPDSQPSIPPAQHSKRSQTLTPSPQYRLA